MQNFPFTEKQGEYGLSTLRITARPRTTWEECLETLDQGIREAEIERRASLSVWAMLNPVDEEQLREIAMPVRQLDNEDLYQKAEIYRATRLGIHYLLAMGQTGPETTILTTSQTIKDCIKDSFSYALALGIVLQDCINAVYATRQIDMMVDTMGLVEDIKDFVEEGLDAELFNDDGHSAQTADNERQEIAFGMWTIMEQKALYFLSYVPYTLDFDLALPLLDSSIAFLLDREKEQLKNFLAMVEAQREYPKAPSPS